MRSDLYDYIRAQLLGRVNWHRRHQLYLADQKAFLVLKLLVVLLPILQEHRQELEKSFPVVDQDLLNGNGFLRVGYKDLPDCQLT